MIILVKNILDIHAGNIYSWLTKLFLYGIFLLKKYVEYLFISLTQKALPY